jgi:hypothetical protein
METFLRSWLSGISTQGYFSLLSRVLRRKEGRFARFFLVKNTKKEENVPNDHKVYQMAMKYTKWLILENLPNGHKIYQMVNIISNLPLNIPNGIYLTLSNMDENGHKIYQMATQIYQMAKKYNTIFRSQPIRKIYKIYFFVCNYLPLHFIWQP